MFWIIKELWWQVTGGINNQIKLRSLIINRTIDKGFYWFLTINLLSCTKISFAGVFANNSPPPKKKSWNEIKAVYLIVFRRSSTEQCYRSFYTVIDIRFVSRAFNIVENVFNDLFSFWKESLRSEPHSIFFAT